MPRYEHSGSAVASTLSTSITAVSTTINITTTTGWPTGAVGPFWVTIDAGTASEEKVLITSRTAGSLTVSARGQDGTTATSHASGAPITHTFSATEADAANAHVETTSGSAHGLTLANVVTTTGTQTLTDKTLTSPTVNTPTISKPTVDVPLGRRNVIRNGDMGVAQRGNGAFTASSPSAATIDGWCKEHSGGTHSVARNGRDVNWPSGYYLQSVGAGTAAATDYTVLLQRIEGVQTLAGKEVTLSFLAQATSGTPKMGVEVTQHFGTGGTPSADVNTAISAVTISTTTTRYTVTFTVPSISGKTLGTAGNDHLTLRFWLSAGSNWAARASSIGIQNATINITDVQLEEGRATAFERLDQQAQLAWCQRYFVRFDGTLGGNNAPIGAIHGPAASATTADLQVKLPVPMRVSPSFASSALGNLALYDGVANPVLTAASVSVATPDAVRLSVTAGGGGLQARGQCVLLRSGALSPAYIEFSAEL